MSISALLDKFKSTRARTELICAPLSPEDHIPQASYFVSPAKWHLAHVSWFFEEMILKTYLAEYVPFNPEFSCHFNSYYQSLGKRVKRTERGLMTRPGLAGVMAYLAYVDKEMLKLFSGDLDPQVIDLINLGLQHEQQHQELLITDIKYLFAQNPSGPVYKESKALVESKNKNLAWLELPAGKYEIGHKSDGFCFDNELGHHEVYLDNYSLSQSLVTNGEFLEFIEDGGYQKFKFWLDEGWYWREENKHRCPIYWKKDKDKWWQFTLAGWRKLNEDDILSHINYYEAAAFAEWKGFRLPTEFEWEAASAKLNWGDRWEWTNSAYLAYPRFKKASGAVGEYNGKFMINQMVLRGGSVATAKGHSRYTYRNFFHPSMAWQFNGIRLAQL